MADNREGENQSNIDADEALRRRLNTALDEPQFRSRQAEIIAQVRQEQARRANNGRVVPAAPRRSPIWATPRWAGALAAVFVLLVVAVVIIVAIGNNKTGSNFQQPQAAAVRETAPTQAATTAAATTAAATTAAATTAAATTAAAAAGVAAPAANATQFSTTDNSASKGGAAGAAATGITTAAATTAAATTAAATTAAATTAAATTAAATTAAGTTAAASAGTRAPSPTVAPVATSDQPKLPPGGLPVFPGAVALNIPQVEIQDFLTGLDANLSTGQRDALGLQEVDKLQFSPQYTTRARSTLVTAQQAITFYQDEGRKAGYSITITNLRNDDKVNASWLVLEKAGTRVGILIVEFKDAAEADKYFGGKLGTGEADIFFTTLP